eukprot:793876-Amorphochlora_amoeboformis.AAC.1
MNSEATWTTKLKLTKDDGWTAYARIEFGMMTQPHRDNDWTSYAKIVSEIAKVLFNLRRTRSLRGVDFGRD